MGKPVDMNLTFPRVISAIVFVTAGNFTGQWLFDERWDVAQIMSIMSAYTLLITWLSYRLTNAFIAKCDERSES